MNSASYENPCGTMTTYQSPQRIPGLCSRIAPSSMFYLHMLPPVARLALRAQQGRADDYEWIRSSVGVMRAFEHVGCTIQVEGLEHLDSINGPCVIAANHMSTLETFVLPCIIQPRKPVTFVVKTSLTTMPIFGPIMRSRDPVVVQRKNAREDLTTVLEEGEKRLKKGISIVVFPQSTRSVTFNSAKFNSIATKLAKRAQVPLVPLALQTNTWAQGKIMKDFGLVFPKIPTFFRFGPPLRIADTGKAEHTAVLAFIEASLKEWKKD